MRVLFRFLTVVLILGILTILSISAQDELQSECEGLTPAPMVIGHTGRVLPGDANTLRMEPSTSAKRLGSIPGGELFLVVEGPVCTEEYVWWRVEYGQWVGWTADGAEGELWLEPVLIDVSDMLITEDNASDISELRVLRCGDIVGSNGAVALGPDEEIVVFGCGVNSGAGEASWPIAVMDLATDEIIHMLTGHGNPPQSILFLPSTEDDPNTRRLLTNGFDGYGRVTTYIWDLKTGEELASADPSSTGHVLLLPDESALAFNNGKGALLLDAFTLDPIGEFSTEGLLFDEGKIFELTRGLAIRPGNTDITTLLATMDGYGNIVVWDMETRDVLHTMTQVGDLTITQQRVALAFSPSGDFLISAICTDNGSRSQCLSAEVAWWFMLDGIKVEAWTLDLQNTFNSGPSSLVFNPDGSLLAVGMCDTLAFYNVAPGKLVTLIPANAEVIKFGGDGSYILGACNDTALYGMPGIGDSLRE